METNHTPESGVHGPRGLQGCSKGTSQAVHPKVLTQLHPQR